MPLLNCKYTKYCVLNKQNNMFCWFERDVQGVRKKGVPATLAVVVFDMLRANKHVFDLLI